MWEAHFTLKTTYFRSTYFPSNKLIVFDFVFVSVWRISWFYALENNRIPVLFGSAVNKLSLQGQGTVRRWYVLLPYCVANTAHSVQAPVIANGRCSWFSNQGSHFTTPYNQNNIIVRTARTSLFDLKSKYLNFVSNISTHQVTFCHLAYTWGTEIKMHYRGAQISGARPPNFVWWCLEFWGGF